MVGGTLESVVQLKRHLEDQAIDALRELLGQISVIKIKEIEVEDYRPRGERTIIARVAIYGHAHTLACKIVGSSNSHDLQKAFLELTKLLERFPEKTTSVLIAPLFSEEAQDVCRKSNTGFLDLEGNARLYLDEVFIVKRSLPLHKTLPPPAESLPTSETARFARTA
jgi:hypothetical protein